MATQVKTGLIANDAITDAKIANVALTGVTASSGDSSTSLATTAFVATEINSLIDSAPGALNTLNELAAALGDDANFSTTVTNSIATKLPLAGGTMSGNLVIADDSANTEKSFLIRNTTVTSMMGVEGSSANRFVGSAANNMFLGTTTADGIEFATNNNVRAVIDVSGNVGIGTSSPQRELHVQNSSSGATSTSNSVAVFEGNDNTEVSILGGSSSVLGLNFGHSGDNNDGIITYNTSSGSEQMDLYVNAAPRMSIDKDGKVGIGNTSPSAKLHVKSAGTGNVFYVESSDGHHLGGFYQESDTRAAFNVRDASGNVKVNLDAGGNSWFDGGNVGIGITSPTKKLNIKDTTQTNQSLLFGPHGAAYGEINYNSTGLEHLYIDAHGTTTGYGNIVLRTGPDPATRMFIHANGNVGIGAGSPDNKLDISGTNTDQVRFNSFRILSNTEATGSETNIMHNATYNSGLKHVVADESALIQFINGEINLKHTTTGTAGGAASFVTSIAAKPHGRVEIVAPELHGAVDGQYSVGGKYVGSSANDWATSAMFMTPTLQSGSSSGGSSQFLSVYTSGHWGEYAVFKLKVYETYYHSNYREYLARCMSNTGQLEVVTQYGSTTYFGYNDPTVTMGSAVDTGTDHSGQRIYRYDFTLTGSGAYYRTHCIVEILYGANRYYSNAVSTSTLNGYNNGGKYHFKTLTAAEMKGKQIA